MALSGFFRRMRRASDTRLGPRARVALGLAGVVGAVVLAGIPVGTGRAAERAGAAAADDGRIHTIYASAACTSPTGPYRTVLEQGRGRRLRFRQERDEQPPFEAIVVGEHGWAIPADGGAPSELPRAQTAMIASHAFHLLAIEPGAWFESRGASREVAFGGARCHEMAVADALLGELTLYRHVGSGLLAGFRIPNPLDPAEEVTIRYLEWTSIAGTQLPTLIMARDASGPFVLDVDSLSVNTVDPDRLRPPDGR